MKDGAQYYFDINRWLVEGETRDLFDIIVNYKTEWKHQYQNEGINPQEIEYLIEDISTSNPHIDDEVLLEYMQYCYDYEGHITKLVLEGQKIRIFPPSICRMPKLRILDLIGNKIEHFPECIGDLTELRELWISENPIKSIPEDITKLVNLRKLDILKVEYNNLSEREKQYLRKLEENGCSIPLNY